jgi:integrase
MSASERPGRAKRETKRDRGDGRIFQQVFRVSKPGEVPPPSVPTGEWIQDAPTGDSVKWSRHRKTGGWTKWKRTKTWFIAYTFRGKTRMESARKADQGIAGTRQDAVKLLKQRREEMGLDKRGLKPFTGPNRERLMFEDLRRIAEVQNTLKPRKAERSWRASWKALDGFFAGMKAIAIDHAKLSEYVEHRLSMHRARGTIRVELAAIRQAFKKAAIDGLAICPTFPHVEESAPRRGFFEADQYTALLDQLPEDIRAVIIFLRESGWRLNEALSLQWRQVDLSTKIVRLDPGMTKNDEGRTFPFGALPALDALLRARRERTSITEAATGRLVPRVFHDEGRPLRPARFYRHWWRAVKAAGIYREWTHAETGKRCRGPIPHDFRRTAVRDLIAAGVPDKVAMEITGHKTREVFDRYHIVTETDKTRGIEKLAALRDSQTLTRSTVVSMQAAERRRKRSR